MFFSLGYKYLSNDRSILSTPRTTGFFKITTKFTPFPGFIDHKWVIHKIARDRITAKFPHQFLIKINLYLEDLISIFINNNCVMTFTSFLYIYFDMHTQKFRQRKKYSHE